MTKTTTARLRVVPTPAQSAAVDAAVIAWADSAAGLASELRHSMPPEGIRFKKKLRDALNANREVLDELIALLAELQAAEAS